MNLCIIWTYGVFFIKKNLSRNLQEEQYANINKYQYLAFILSVILIKLVVSRRLHLPSNNLLRMSSTSTTHDGSVLFLGKISFELRFGPAGLRNTIICETMCVFLSYLNNAIWPSSGARSGRHIVAARASGFLVFSQLWSHPKLTIFSILSSSAQPSRRNRMYKIAIVILQSLNRPFS